MNDRAELRRHKRQMEKFAKRVLHDAVPKIADSGYVIAIAPTRGTEDVKMAVEIGFSILLDKPLIVMVPIGKERHHGEKLLRIADFVVEVDMDSEESRIEAQQKIMQFMQQ